MRKRILAALLSAAVCLSLLPTAAFAAGMQSGTIDLKVNESKVAFAGKEWWVIGYNGQGVYSTANDNHATLLSAKDANNTAQLAGMPSAQDKLRKLLAIRKAIRPKVILGITLITHLGFPSGRPPTNMPEAPCSRRW